MGRELIVTRELPLRKSQWFIADHRAVFADPARFGVTGVTIWRFPFGLRAWNWREQRRSI